MPRKRPPGIKAGLTRGAILAAAQTIADEQGLSALTMRRLADRLGVEPMTLYDHVPNKAALIDGLIESVIAQASDRNMPADVPWDEGLRTFARSLRATLLAHPGVLPLMLSQRGTTAGSLDRVEAMLTTLCDAGLSPARAMAMANAVTLFTTAYTISTAQASRDASSNKGPAPDLTAYPLVTQAVAESEAAGGGFEVTINAIMAGFATLKTD